jgi:hypothetical protein
MLGKLQGVRPSPALVISLVALFVSLGGAGYAAITVTGKNVKNSSLTGKDVKNSSLTGSDVKNSSLTGSDVRDNRLGGSDILESSLGKVPSAGNADSAGSANNANALNGIAASGLVRVARAQDNDNALLPGVSSSGADVVTTSITAPGRGFLVINAGSDISGQPDTSDCVINIDGNDIQSSDRSWQTGAGNQEEDCTTETTQAVNAGNHSVALQNGATLTNASYDEAELQVLFVPFDGAGNRP